MKLFTPLHQGFKVSISIVVLVVARHVIVMARHVVVVARHVVVVVMLF